MDFESSRTERIPVELPNGGLIQVEVSQTGREDVAFDRKAFKDVMDSIEGIVEAIAVPLHKAMPTKASVKFGIDVGIESGNLTAAIVKGTGKANLEITLEWVRS